MQTDIRLIALDLDGTLLTSDKRLTDRTVRALARAAGAGAWIVPATGRFYGGMPASVRALPFLRYAITINGAAVFDVEAGQDIARAEIPLAHALRILEYLDTLPVIYDCYLDNAGWMTAAMQQRAAEFSADPHYLKMIRELRRPVPELKAFLRERGCGVQKIQLFTKDRELRLRMLRELEPRFGALAVSSSVESNVEINDARANKGEALRALAAHLGLSAAQTMAFGDGLNDISMLRAAGTGVAMANAHPEAKAAADQMTESCDREGVAALLEKLF